MTGDELRVEQREAAVFQPGDEIDQRDLARIPCLGEHALAEEGASEMHAVKAADQLTVLPDFHRVAMSERE